MSDRIHIYPITGRNTSDHITKMHEECWCNPEVMQVCCEANKYGECIRGCFKCAGTSIIKPYDPDEDYLIIHKEYQLSRLWAEDRER